MPAWRRQPLLRTRFLARVADVASSEHLDFIEATGRDCSLSTTSVDRRGPPSMPGGGKKGGEKGTSPNRASLAPKPVASSVYVRVPEAPCPHKRSISVMSLFPSSKGQARNFRNSVWRPRNS